MISVCIATHNAEKYILEQLGSILPQLSANDEVIISDDGSKDGTVSLIESLHDDRIRILHYEQKVNYSKKKLSSYYYATSNFYNALLAAKGDVIFLSDQDDRWYGNKVKISLSYLQDCDIVCSNFSIMDGHGTLLQREFWEQGRFSQMNILQVLKYLPFRGCCLAFKKEVLENAFPFPEALFLHDCWIGLNAVFSGFRYKFIDTPLILYRRHETNVSSLESPNSTFFKVWYRLKLLYQLMILRLKRAINKRSNKY